MFSNGMTMELYQLKSFLEVAVAQNLTRAAANLNISQSALSSQIRQLEDELGVVLFVRTARGMTLTERGRLLRSYAEDVLYASRQLQDRAKELSGRQYGLCRIGLNTDGAFLRVSELSRALSKTLPDVNFVFISSQTIRTAEMLRQGLIDVGFFFGEATDPGLETLVLCMFPIAIVVPEVIRPQGSRLGWAEAAQLPWIWSVCDCPYYRVVQEKLDELGLVPRKILDAMDESVVRELVLDGQGLAILREDEAYAAAKQGGVWIWEDVRFTLPLRLGRLRQSTVNPLFDAVFTTIRQLWAEHQAVGEA